MNAVKVGVVACSKTKARGRCAAVDLYRGRTYLAAVDLLRAWGCDRIVILSALHGAMPDHRVVDPYEWSLAKLNAMLRRQWADAARIQIASALRTVGGTKELADIDVHAIVPAAYAGALDGIRHTRHFEGLSQGKLFAALKAAREVA